MRLGIRAVAYATVFTGLLLALPPAAVADWSGVTRPSRMGLFQVVGAVLAGFGGLLYLWCVQTFVVLGHGTPKPFCPPRRLVIVGPYRVLRNPMYAGVAVVLGGASLFWQSLELLGCVIGFLVVAHWLVVWYEEPRLRRTFGADYDAYCGRVGRWWPRLGGGTQRVRGDKAEVPPNSRLQPPARVGRV